MTPIFEEDAQYDADLRQAIVETEKEIFNAGVGSEGDEDEREGHDQIIEEGSDVEGWNGDSLPLDEIAAANIEGHSSTGNDRPLATMDEQALREELVETRKERDLTNQLNNEFVYGPQRQQQAEQIRENVRLRLIDQYGLMDLEPEKFDRFINDVSAAQAHTSALEEARCNASFEHARNQYGSSFDRAYHDLTTLPITPTTRALVTDDLMKSSDPGERLMVMWDSGILQGLGAGSRPPPPFLAQIQGQRARAARAARQPTESERSWSEEADVESDIFNSAVWD
jgi:hypothetical protein